MACGIQGLVCTGGNGGTASIVSRKTLTNELEVCKASRRDAVPTEIYEVMGPLSAPYTLAVLLNMLSCMPSIVALMLFTQQFTA